MIPGTILCVYLGVIGRTAADSAAHWIPLGLGLAATLAAVAFLVGAVLGPRARRDLERRELILVAVGIGVVGGVVLGLLAWLSGGSAGPGRLVEVGPNPWWVGVWAVVEISAASLIGLLSSLRGIASRARR